ncbi:MAG: DUF11 domain-containing protein [Anaerolineae bacterium]|nr:DUF11 domain-containing protein [Anaerolineae bacterium]
MPTATSFDPLTGGACAGNADDGLSIDAGTFYCGDPLPADFVWNQVKLYNANFLTPTGQFTSFVVTVVNSDTGTILVGPVEIIGSGLATVTTSATGATLSLLGLATTNTHLKAVFTYTAKTLSIFTGTVRVAASILYTSTSPAEFCFQTSYTCDPGTGQPSVLTNTVRTALDNLTEGPVPVGGVCTAVEDLSVTKTDNVLTYTSGSVVTYTLVLSNAGPAPAVNAVVSDTQPAQISSWNWTCVNGAGAASCTAGSGNPFTDTVDLGVGSRITYTVVASLYPTATGTLTNTVTVTPGLGAVDLTPGNNTATDVDTTSHDLVVVKGADAASVASVRPGQTITYRIAYTNTGTEVALGARMSDTVPVSTTYVSCAGGVSCASTGSAAGSVVAWNLGNVAPWASAAVTLVVLIDSAPMYSGTKIGNTAVITDVSGITKTTTTTVTAQTAHTLTIAKTNSPSGLVAAGERITYTLNWSVTGNEPAPGVVISDAIPANTTGAQCSAGSSPVNCAGLPAGSAVNWTLGTVNPLSSGSVSLVVIVNSGVASGTQIVNVGVISDVTKPPTTTPPVTNPVGSPIVVLGKVAAVFRNPVGANDIVTYTLRLTNTGNLPAYGVTLTDTLPANVSYVIDVAGNARSDPAGPIGTPSQSGQQQVWAIGQMNPGSVATVAFRARISSAVGASVTLTNAAGGSYTAVPNGPVTPTTPATATVRSGDPELSIVKSASPVPVEAGGLLTYTIRVSNTGIVSATGVWISDVVPLRTTFYAAPGAAIAPAQGAAAGSVVQWNLGTLDANGLNPKTVTFTVLVDTPLVSGTLVLNTAVVTSTNSVTKTTTVTDPVSSRHDLFITKTVNAAGAVAPGRELQYSLAWLVTGNEPAPNVTVRDALPANTVYVPGSCTPACAGPDPLVWSLGTLNPGMSGTVTFSVTVNSPLNNGTQIVNTGSITDSTGITKTSTVTSPVFSSHDVFITKTVSPAGNVSPGTELRYTLNWSVSGNEVAPSVTLVDSIPANTTYVVGSCTNTCGGPDPLVWALGNQNPGAAGSVSFSVTVNSPLNNGTQIRNSASITDSTGLTKTTTVTTPVTSAHDVFITKTVSPAGNVSPGTELRYT